MDRGLQRGGLPSGKGLMEPLRIVRAVGREPVTGARLHLDRDNMSTCEYAPSSTIVE
jgi:hypothetical protein